MLLKGIGDIKNISFSFITLIKLFYKFLYLQKILKKIKINLKIFNGGYLGSHIDEERSQMRYAMRIAEFRESSDL